MYDMDLSTEADSTKLDRRSEAVGVESFAVWWSSRRTNRTFIGTNLLGHPILSSYGVDGYRKTDHAGMDRRT